MTNLDGGSTATRDRQLSLFGSSEELRKPPTTRYQGSKLKLLPWLCDNLDNLEFETALDAFGGTGCVSYMLKCKGKRVTYNDYLKFNHLIGLALVENSHIRLSGKDIAFALTHRPGVEYDNFIARTFVDVFFTAEEDAWLDVVCQNIPLLDGAFKRAIAYYALFQSCIIKRPYNLFHRKNLYMRTSDVERSFGNKATWDTRFEEHFRKFAHEANAAVFDSGVPCKALCHDALDVPGEYDLVYIDTPYVSKSGVGVDYRDFYHFLEGITDYNSWPNRINGRKKHFPLVGKRSRWSDARRTCGAFSRLFDRYAESILVVSYRNDGIPSENQLVTMLQRVKKNVQVLHFGGYKYVLSKNDKSKEILLIGT
ncbi:MAG: DNA adenine methylase [Planctomycetota bacterium]|jgi:adenine-specific DNA methylase